MSNDIDRKKLEADMREARKQLDLGNALKRLKDNKDFKAVILDGYFKDEAVRLVHLRSDVAHQHPEQQRSLLLAIDSIGNLHTHLAAIEHTAGLASKVLEDGDSTLEEMAREDLAA